MAGSRAFTRLISRFYRSNSGTLISSSSKSLVLSDSCCSSIQIPKNIRLVVISQGFCTSSKRFQPINPFTMEDIKSEVSSTTENEGQDQQQPVENSSGCTDDNLPQSSSQVETKPAVIIQQQDQADTSISENQISQSGNKVDVEEGSKKIFLRKRKCVLMLSYCGQDYFGMQKNPGAKTIEEDLLRSLLTCGYIDEESYNKPQVMQFQRAARTDKHVSAARQIVSLKLPDNFDLEEVNKLLPPAIRVMSMKKVTKGFDCKGSCDARTYMYMIPSFAFAPIDQLVDETYRITPEVIENLREALKLYLGTKNFHNFTSRRKPTDPSSRRYIMSFTASDPFIKDGLEYVILRVKGQSFMLHQIRKMIGLIVAYLRGFAGKETFVKSWSLDRIDIPKAPGVGLVLDLVHYERYNKRYGSDGMHQTLTWGEVNDKVEEFCQEFIYPIITKSENVEKSMFNWLATLPYHTYDIREEKGNTPLLSGNISKALSAIGQAASNVEKVVEEDTSEGESDDEDDGVSQAKKPRKMEKASA